MSKHTSVWSVVLAAGDGRRLHGLTRDASGRAVPKQYCTLDGGPTLLRQALDRGRALSGRKRLCAIVARQHSDWWPSALQALATDNVYVQPENRGTANGILWPLLSILAREPWANVVFLPADHFVADEGLLRASVQHALDRIPQASEEVMIVGVMPREVDPGLGYIVPAWHEGEARRVVRFVEKPSADAALELILGGALWNSFIFAARAGALLDMLRERAPHVVAAMEDAIRRPQPAAIDHLYQSLPNLDFSRDVLAGSERRLQVVPAGECGWTDLGTPHRLSEALHLRGTWRLSSRPPRRGDPAAPVDLATALRTALAARSRAVA
jgi:mannose-1-phosphate guanylyltransferase